VFTGITGGIGRVVSVGSSLVVDAGSLVNGVEIGASMAVNGVCLTVTTINDKAFTVDIMPETLRRTNLGMLKAGDTVNLERALAFGGEM